MPPGVGEGTGIGTVSPSGPGTYGVEGVVTDGGDAGIGRSGTGVYVPGTAGATCPGSLNPGVVSDGANEGGDVGARGGTGVALGAATLGVEALAGRSLPAAYSLLSSAFLNPTGSTVDRSQLHEETESNHLKMLSSVATGEVRTAAAPRPRRDRS